MPYRTNLPRLMLVTDRRRIRGRELVPLVVQAARGGVGIVQLRERDLTNDEVCVILPISRRLHRRLLWLTMPIWGSLRNPCCSKRVSNIS